MAKELNIDRYVVAGEFPGVIVIEPVVWNLDLVPINDLIDVLACTGKICVSVTKYLLFENTVSVSQAVSPSRKLDQQN